MSNEYLKKEFEQICNSINVILVDKNADYGDGNLLRDGLLGVAIRLGDKVERIKNLCIKDAKVNESIEDTLKDIAGYCINSLRLLKENKMNLHNLNVDKNV